MPPLPRPTLRPLLDAFKNGTPDDPHPIRSGLAYCVRSQYFWACFVYLAYTSGQLAIGHCPWPDQEPDPDSDDNTTLVPNDLCSPYGWKGINSQYVFWNIIHLVNAFQFLFSWMEANVKFWHPLCWPEYLNILEAILYLYASTYYADLAEADYEDPALRRNQRFEASAAYISLVAAFGWVITWWCTYPRDVPGRGWTLDDPDIFAWMTIVAASVMYARYYVIILGDPYAYGTEYLYQQADVVFFVSACFYLLASMRDSGLFYWTPTAGGWDWRILPAEEKLPLRTTPGMPTTLALGHASRHEAPV